MKKTLVTVAVLGLILIGCGKSEKQNSPTVTASSSTSTSRYAWTAEGLSFEHPNSWTKRNPLVPADQAGQQTEVKPSDPLVALYSPNIVKVTAIGFGDVVQEEGAYTGSFAVIAESQTSDEFTGVDASDVHVRKVIPLKVPGYKQLSIVELGTDNSHTSRLALTDASVVEGSIATKLDDSFASKKTAGSRISMSVGIFAQEDIAPQTFAFANTTTGNFEKAADYGPALEILKSVAYS